MEPLTGKNRALAVALIVTLLFVVQESLLRFAYSPDDFDMTQPQYRQGAERLAGQCSRMGIPFVSAIPAMERLEQRGEHLYWNYDDHLRVTGNEAVARILLEAWTPLSRDRTGPHTAPPENP